MNRSFGSTYTMFLNGEPVNWSAGGANTLVHGYPLHQGTNQITVKLLFPSGFWLYKERKPLPQDTYHVFVELDVQETNQGALLASDWDKVCEWTDSWPPDEPFVWEPECVVERKIADPGFEELGTNEALYVAQCKTIAVKLAKLVQKQDYEQLARVFGVTNRAVMKTVIPAVMAAEHRIPAGAKAALLDECPALVYQEIRTNEVLVTGISTESEVEAITGKHLILVYPGPGRHFSSFLNTASPTLMRQWETLSIFDGLKYAGVFSTDSFVLGRAGGKWKFTACGSGWIKNGWGLSAYGNGWLDLNLKALE